MAALIGPFEILDIQDSEAVEFHALRYEEGTVIVKPTDGRPPLELEALRVHIRPSDKTAGLPWWDITSKTLRAQLVEFLKVLPQTGQRFRVTAHGVKPRKRFTLERR